MAIFQVDRTQYPIGQGGFHFVALHTHRGQRFSMVVDCGGSRAKHRKLLARAFAERESEHDFLVISHLDDDHINGLEELQDAGVSFRTVFLPHVDIDSYIRWMTLKLSLSANAGGALAGFSKVARQLYGGHFGPVVLVGDPDDEDEDHDDPEDHSAYRENGNNDQVLSNDARQAIAQATNAGTVLSCSTSLTLDLDWLIRFYSREWKVPDEVALIWDLGLLQGLKAVLDSTGADFASCDWNKFTVDLELELKKKADKSLAAHLSSLLPAADPRAPALQKLSKEVAVGKMSCKKLLTELYRIITTLHDYNDASMCVYSGPAERGVGVRRNFFQRSAHSSGSVGRPSSNAPTRAVGWIHTGDASFTTNSRLKDFIDHYIMEVSLTSVLVLPHHGSRRSFDPDLSHLYKLAASLAKPTLFLAPADPSGKYHHPDTDVVHACLRLGDLTIVDEDASSTYLESAATVWHWDPYWEM